MDNEITKRLAGLRENIKGLKTNQTVGGDSWVMYRAKIVITMSPASTFQVDFIPDVEGSFVSRAYSVPASDEVFGYYSNQLDPDPNYDGRWYVTNSSGDLTVEQGILFYTTRRGRIVATKIKPAELA